MFLQFNFPQKLFTTLCIKSNYSATVVKYARDIVLCDNIHFITRLFFAESCSLVLLLATTAFIVKDDLFIVRF